MACVGNLGRQFNLLPHIGRDNNSQVFASRLEPIETKIESYAKFFEHSLLYYYAFEEKSKKLRRRIVVLSTESSWGLRSKRRASAMVLTCDTIITRKGS